MSSSSAVSGSSALRGFSSGGAPAPERMMLAAMHHRDCGNPYQSSNLGGSLAATTASR